MNLRFSPFRKRQDGPITDINRQVVEPVPQNLVPRRSDKLKSMRVVSIVHPDEEKSFLLKAQLLSDGHRTIDTFFLPESFVSVVNKGHRPDVIFVHDFIAEEAGMTGVELTRSLRLNHDFTGLIYSTSDDHADMSEAALGIHGFSGHAKSYLAR